MAVSVEKQASFSLTLTPEERKALHIVAEREGMKAAAWIRSQILKAWGDEPLPAAPSPLIRVIKVSK